MEQKPNQQLPTAEEQPGAESYLQEVKYVFDDVTVMPTSKFMIDGEWVIIKPIDPLPPPGRRAYTGEPAPALITVSELAKRYSQLLDADTGRQAVRRVQAIREMVKAIKTGIVGASDPILDMPVEQPESRQDEFLWSCLLDHDAAIELCVSALRMKPDAVLEMLTPNAPHICDQDPTTSSRETTEQQPAFTALVIPEEPSKPPEEIRKKEALVKELSSVWQEIEEDLSDAGRNGLRKYAKEGEKHGFWRVAGALRWAKERGRITKDSARSFVKQNDGNEFSAMLRQMFNI